MVPVDDALPIYTLLIDGYSWTTWLPGIVS